MQIYLLQDGEKSSLYTVYEVAGRVRDGKLTEETLGWHQGCEGWTPLGELAAVASAFVEAVPRAAEVAAEEFAQRRARLAPERLRSSVRLWARLFDMMWLGWVISMVAMATGMIEPAQLVKNPPLELALLPAAVLMFLEGFLLHAVGTTPGKWLLHVYVHREDGQRIPLATAFQRSFTVWWRGIGFWLFPLNIFMMVLSQAALLSEGVTPWDRACGLKVSSGKVDRGRVLLIIGIFLALVVVMNIAFGEALMEAVKPAEKPSAS